MGNVAIVNGRELTKSYFDYKLEVFMEMLKEEEQVHDMSTAELYEIKSSVIDDMIDHELILQFAEKNNIAASPDEIKKQFEKVKQAFKNEDEFMNSLQNKGLKLQEILEEVRRSIIIEKVIDNEIEPNLEKVDEKTIKAYYDENLDNFNAGEAVHPHHIFIRVNDFENNEEVMDRKQRINAIYDKLVSGEEFGTLAKEYSECKSGERGGDLGVLVYDEIDEDFADVVFSMKKGSYSKPFPSDAGYHIVYLEDKNKSYLLPFEKIKSQLEEYIMSIIEDDAIEVFVNELRENAEIQIFEY